MAGWAAIPTIRVPDMDEAMAFYRDKLEFFLDRDEYSAENNSITRGDAHLQLEALGDFRSDSHNQAIRERMGNLSPSTIYIETEDIHGFYERLGEVGVTIVDPILERPWGLWEFTLEDHLGNWLTFWHRDGSARSSEGEGSVPPCVTLTGE